jgi:hypothetical protein
MKNQNHHDHHDHPMIKKIRSKIPMDVKKYISKHLTPMNPVDVMENILVYTEKYLNAPHPLPPGMPNSITIHFQKNLRLLVSNQFPAPAIIIRIERVEGSINMSADFLVTRTRFAKSNILRLIFFALDNLPLRAVRNQALLQTTQAFSTHLDPPTRKSFHTLIQKSLHKSTADPEWLALAKKTLLLYGGK